MLIFRVCMKGTTWVRDSHGLYDYEDRENLKQYNFQTSSEMSIIRYGDKLISREHTAEMISVYEDQIQSLKYCSEPLFKIINKNNSMFYVEAAQCSIYTEEFKHSQRPVKNKNDNMYLVVRSLVHNNIKIVSCSQNFTHIRIMKSKSMIY